MIAFHASASGTGLPINPFPGSATADSDIFAVNVDDLLEDRALPQNLTSNRSATVDDESELVARWPEDPLHELPR